MKPEKKDREPIVVIEKKRILGLRGKCIIIKAGNRVLDRRVLDVIENLRKMRVKVEYLPAEGKIKIYIKRRDSKEKTKKIRATVDILKIILEDGELNDEL